MIDDVKIGTTDIDKIYIGNVLYWQRQAPVNHTELLYLQSSGTQYINTGIVGQNGLKIEIKAQILNIGITGCIIGSRISATSKTFAITHNTTPIFYTGYNNSTSATSNSVSLGTDYVLVKNDNALYINDVLQHTATIGTFINNLNMYIFALNQNGAVTQQDQMKCYYCKIWDSSGVLLRDFIPVQKDGVYCLFDKVTQTYFYNQGTGEFIGG